MYTYENYLLEAIETVSAWDLDDDQFTEAVNAQARLMAGLDFQEITFEQKDSSALIIQ
jgi:hypothetical protein